MESPQGTKNLGGGIAPNTTIIIIIYAPQGHKTANHLMPLRGVLCWVIIHIGGVAPAYVLTPLFRGFRLWDSRFRGLTPTAKNLRPCRA